MPTAARPSSTPHHSRSIHIERKLFTIRGDPSTHYQSVIISERSSNSNVSLKLSCTALDWMVRTFKMLHHEPCNHKLYQKLVDDNATIWIQKLCNKHGFFVEITHLLHTGRRTTLFIPAEEQKQGWFSFFSLLSDYRTSPPSPPDHLPAPAPIPPPFPTFQQQPSLDTPSIPHLDWPRMVIIQRSSPCISWQTIKNFILSSLQFRCTINPFVDNKALLHVYDQMIVNQLLSYTTGLSIGNYKINILDATVLSSYNCDVISSLGGWIDIHNLPPPLWTEAVLRYIGDLCGGFIGVSNQTEHGINLQAAKIKIHPPVNGFIPASIALPSALAGTDWVVSLKMVNNSSLPLLAPEPNLTTDPRPTLRPEQPPLDSSLPSTSPQLPSPPAQQAPSSVPTQPLPIPHIPPNHPAINASINPCFDKGKSPMELPLPKDCFNSPPLSLAPNLPLSISVPQHFTLPTKLPILLTKPSNSPSPSFTHPSLTTVTFPEGPTNLTEATTHFTSNNGPAHYPSDTEAFLSSPSADIDGHSTDFEAHSLDIAIFGDEPTAAQHPLNILPPIPEDLSRSVPANLPQSPCSTHSQSVKLPTSLSLPDLATILAQHGLCIMAIPALPPTKPRKHADTNNRRNKLQRELQNLHTSINYDKDATLLLSEGVAGVQ